MTRIILLVFLGLAVAACAARYQWTKQGEGEGAAEVASKDCKEEARGYNFLDGPDQSIRVMTSRGERYSNINTNTAEREADIFNDCMRAKGFELAPVTEK